MDHDLLIAAVRRTVAGVTKIHQLESQVPTRPQLSPGPACGWCPAATGCPAALARAAEAGDNPD